jgi:hypothetical protein
MALFARNLVGVFPTLRNFDRILVLHAGKARQSGTADAA